jgi:hypothetical protein
MTNHDSNTFRKACQPTLGGVVVLSVSKVKVQKGKAPWGSAVFRTRFG